MLHDYNMDLLSTVAHLQSEIAELREIQKSQERRHTSAVNMLNNEVAKGRVKDLIICHMCGVLQRLPKNHDQRETGTCLLTKDAEHVVRALYKRPCFTNINKCLQHLSVVFRQRLLRFCFHEQMPDNDLDKLSLKDVSLRDLTSVDGSQLAKIERNLKLEGNIAHAVQTLSLRQLDSVTGLILQNSDPLNLPEAEDRDLSKPPSLKESLKRKAAHDKRPACALVKQKHCVH